MSPHGRCTSALLSGDGGMSNSCGDDAAGDAPPGDDASAAVPPLAAACSALSSLSLSSARVGTLERRACSVWNARDCGHSMSRLCIARMRSG